MKALAEEAVAKFPIDPMVLELARLTNNRIMLEGVVHERVLWMLNRAYDYGRSDPRD